MIIKDVTNYIEEIAPLAYAESFDNVGLLIGDYNTVLTGVLVTLDTLEKTIDQAIAENCNLIISFHPIIFKGLKKITGKTYVERVVLKAIQNNIAIYATHTALDNSKQGVSAKMCEVLGLSNCSILIPKNKNIRKLTTYTPTTYIDSLGKIHVDLDKKLREALFEVGAGAIGNYDSCSFNVSGIGTYKGRENSNPVIGEIGELCTTEEVSISVTYQQHLESDILRALKKNHIYEEVAYEVTTLENFNQNMGMGMVGELSIPMDEQSFIGAVKKTFVAGCVRHSGFFGKKIKKVAVLGGSGSFAIGNAKAIGADAYISADFKYHDFFQAEDNILLVDVGHYESEQFTKKLLYNYLNEKFSTFAIVLSEESTNPIYYS